MKIVAVVGARPNFVKIAPIVWETQRRAGIETYLVHTGQHYDEKLSRVFFEELSIPAPDVDLGVGSGSHAVQTAEVMKRFEPVVLERRPNLVLVVGDVNSTLACALTAAKLEVPVAHVEAGLRSFDERMPEELNRRLTDQISRWLFISEASGIDNLRREGIAGDRMHLVGNVMIDTLMACRERIDRSDVLDRLQLASGGFALLTLHRPSNVDDRAALSGLLRAIGEIAVKLPILFPVHPRTTQRLREAGFDVSAIPGVRCTEPLGYIDFLKLQASARVVLTDSGGVQEETTALGVPCLTLRENTERPITISHGTNQLVGNDPDRLISAVREIAKVSASRSVRPELWDGRAAVRIIDVLEREAGSGRSACRST
jgi:UDP-N-acetylglucosamine 2-epimerase (non-hydrolysing)